MDQPAGADRRRADAFGLAAENYHRYRPRYPDGLIADLVDSSDIQVLDVGAGTGIASKQLQDIGANVLAVEPDSRMARVAASNGIRVEQSAFEDWDPDGRRFDLAVFAQSFHWVRPHPALDKISSILRPGGRLVLLSNRITPISPTRVQLDEAYGRLQETSARLPVDAVHNDELMTTIESYGYSIERRQVLEPRHFAGDAWIDMVFTHSNVLTLDTRAQNELRSRLEQIISLSGVDAENHATAVIATPLATAC